MTKNTVNTLYLIINNINGYIEEIYENKYLTLITIEESKDTLEQAKNCYSHKSGKEQTEEYFENNKERLQEQAWNKYGILKKIDNKNRYKK